MATVLTPRFDPELITRYDVPGPRYTSYPTAPHFGPTFGEHPLVEAAQRSNHARPARPLSLYVHVPFCASPCFYCGCNRIITRDTSRADRYLAYLDIEASLLGPLFDESRPVRQLHLGGGTPNFLDIQRMGVLMGSLREYFSFAGDGEHEFGIEVDPRFADADYIRGLAALGFNRLSLGVQDLDPGVQKAVNRVHDVDTVRGLMQAAREAGFRSISMDLIYGLPQQDVARFSHTLEQVIELAPDRIATYSYAHLPSLFKAQRRLERSELPDAATKLALFGRTLELLTTAGYQYVGMDHFALSDDDLVRAQREGTLQRNFQGYSTCGDCDIVGLGVSAIGRIDDTYSQNHRDLKDYTAALDHGHLPVARGHRLDADDLIRRDAIGELMCYDRLDMAAFGARHHIDFASYFAHAIERLSPLQRDGLVTIDHGCIEVTPRGRLLLRHVAMCFDAYLHGEDVPQRYSRAI
ncbi:oxygen-independent coproporphyrinogen III oxidase [Oleiagrimonas sp. C23AA]|uniref:oxygen-independent coproporphyrinogen III oxidase n=1 Tax=Oleiagrimonas sp. C23AA TaxID=2719047 RepID=UPI00141F3B94|nr:oxygen-independent coproporphyrinogen III oxidase [Oleiagrimonas sp. C23AA]NII11848.1 oxygen-independent coproporphyrinogen III oxidase [Oleiagrimonas sp. C23AA]